MLTSHRWSPWNHSLHCTYLGVVAVVIVVAECVVSSSKGAGVAVIHVVVDVAAEH